MSWVERRTCVLLLGSLAALAGCVIDADARSKMPPFDEGLDLKLITSDPLGRTARARGVLRVTSDPESHAHVMVASYYAGRTPLELTGLPAGSYRVAVVSGSGERHVHDATVGSAHTANVRAVLGTREPEPGLAFVEQMIEAEGGGALQAHTAWARCHGTFVLGELSCTIDYFFARDQFRQRFACPETWRFPLKIKDMAMELRVSRESVEWIEPTTRRVARGPERMQMLETLQFDRPNIYWAAFAGEASVEVLGDSVLDDVPVKHLRIRSNDWPHPHDYLVDSTTYLIRQEEYESQYPEPAHSVRTTYLDYALDGGRLVARTTRTTAPEGLEARQTFSACEYGMHELPP
jgi:hypothetical protein